MILVTCYENPDIDGIASAYAYAEYLKKRGFDAEHGVFGKPRNFDTFFVFDKLGIRVNSPGKYDKVAIVDASDTWGLSKSIKPDDVIVVIDHRKVNHAEKFRNASVQIEQVGSAATLIAEKFYNHDIKPSKESALLLYSAVLMSTINFRSNTTRDRDIEMADWLKQFCNIEDDFLHELFIQRSKIVLPLEEHLNNDFSIFGNIGIAQLEIVDVDNFVDRNLDEIKRSLENINKKRKLEHTFLSCIDLEKGFNLFVIIDEKTQKLLEKILKIKIKNNTAKRQGIIMRKEIAPLIKNQQL